MSRWALFVDAGWLFAGGSTSAFGERLTRREIEWTPGELVNALVPAAADLVPESSELLRTYWYDGSPNRLAIGQQHDVALLRDVKLRLGRTARDGQKGVDGLIIHDLITHAFRRTIDDAVVISGDEDLLDAIESAQAYGTRVHLLEIPIGGIAQALLRAVDNRGVLDETFWKAHLHRLSTDAQPPEPAQTPAVREQTVDHPPRTFVRPAWMDDPLPSQHPVEAPIDVAAIGELVAAGQDFATQWLASADVDEYAEMMALRPYLPAPLDTQLLKTAVTDGRWLDETERRALRDAFWTTLADLRS